ncbi:hypothetical protein [Caballeronia sp. INDeC2]|uniref:hypothetical protein n=1 Tax=Caballeronia sp. INDeC2 TaxID=2921747 RepID=UPI0020291AC4|nr:hypothetical protein [Caballeronia sp. INDeC2]
MQPGALHGRIVLQCAALCLLACPAFAAETSSGSEFDTAPRGGYMASQCKDAARCPLFDEVYATTPPFRHALSLSLRHGGEVVPEWVKDKLPGGSARSETPPYATASAMLPLRIDDRSYLLGRMSDPEMPSHQIVALYDTQRGLATVYHVRQDGQRLLLGDTTEILRKVMTDYLNAGSAFARSVAHPDVPLPISVKTR